MGAVAGVSKTCWYPHTHPHGEIVRPVQTKRQHWVKPLSWNFLSAQDERQTWTICLLMKLQLTWYRLYKPTINILSVFPPEKNKQQSWNLWDQLWKRKFIWIDLALCICIFCTQRFSQWWIENMWKKYVQDTHRSFSCHYSLSSITTLYLAVVLH